jgi:hypothetical protein
VIVQLTELPSFTEAALGVIVEVDVSKIVILELEANIVPVTEPDLRLKTTVSLPSVNRSRYSVRTTVAVLPVIVTEPELRPSVKSGAVVVPVVSQYSIVPSVTYCVVIVKVTALPSFSEVGLPLTLYVGIITADTTL